MIGLYLVALAVVGVPLGLVAYALLRGVRVRVDVDVRPLGDEAPPPRRERTQTRAAPRATGRRPSADPAQTYDTPHPQADAQHPHALGTWGTTTPETGVPRRTTAQGD